MRRPLPRLPATLRSRPNGTARKRMGRARAAGPGAKRKLPQRRDAEPHADVGLELRKLERPADELVWTNTVPSRSDARRPRVPRDLLAYRVPPHLHDLPDRAPWWPKRCHPLRTPSTDALHQPTRTRPASLGGAAAGSTGQRRHLRAVIRVCPDAPMIGKPAHSGARCRSSEEHRRAEQRRDAAALGDQRASAAASESTVRRCSPCVAEAGGRSRSPETKRTSSRCGPRPVVPRSRSRSSRARTRQESATRPRRRASRPEGELARAFGEPRRKRGEASPAARRRGRRRAAQRLGPTGDRCSRRHTRILPDVRPRFGCATAAPYSAASGARGGL